MTIVVSGFPGVGKTFFAQNCEEWQVILDSDSSKFSWTSPGERNPDFPQNYIDHIKSNLGDVTFILVSSHKEVREALKENNIKFTLVYPDKSIKDDYLKRYEDRGSEKAFVELLSKNWDAWLTELEEQENCEHMVLTEGMFLDDVSEFLLLESNTLRENSSDPT